MKTKSYFIFSFILLLIIVAVNLHFNYNANSIIQNSHKVMKTSNTLSLNFETEVDSGEYAASTNSTWPTSGYILNTKLSGCENSGKVSWNMQKKKLVIQGNISDKCYVYFDKINDTFIFNYKEEGQRFDIPYTGTYKIELWGASGGDLAGYLGGRGAYTSGNIHLNEGQTIYIYTGGLSTTNNVASFNGGGASVSYNLFGMPGGGATDIRLESGNWNDFNGLKSRIMVAAGGGGANNRNSWIDSVYWYGAGNGGYGGALVGGDGESLDETHTNPNTGKTYGWYIGLGGSQTKGGESECHAIVESCPSGDTSKTYFGYAISGQSGGGGGYYVGGGGAHGGAGGGSSFISGHTGCNAIMKESTENNIIHSGSPNHYSNYIFTDTLMIAGNAEMPNPEGGTEIGHTGKGLAKITLIELG